jgi:tRNA (guanine37-N1)-methyltransferase|uniref:tRNA (guanine-N(1)-)-methyltransferase n=1 Tax=Desulfomonile tiedjei TaxID=2358 RepID=A0A7C4EV21_9BACT
MIDVCVLTIFPGIFDSFMKFGNTARALEKNLLRFRAVDLRDFTDDRRRTTDDYPYGGGRGMIMKPEPIVKGIRFLKETMTEPRVILTTPQAPVFNQEKAEELSKLESMIIVCGRYEGVDERVRCYVDDEISVGDYILSGGEIAAMVILDAVVRLIPGVLGSDSHIGGDSFYDGLLEYPQYTRPRVFEGMSVPWVLIEGHHEKIRTWRLRQSLARTLARRPDLLEKKTLNEVEARMLSEIRARCFAETQEKKNECA